MDKPHIDFLLTINKSYVDRIISGDALTGQDVIDAFMIANEINKMQEERLNEQVVRLDNLEGVTVDSLKVIKAQYKRSDDCYTAFLRSKGLEGEFEIFSMRLDRKIYKSKMTKENSL